MTTLVSLFGGLASVLILYLLAGLFRGLPTVLRAVLAGTIPLVGYFALIVGRWPGLDVVAIHISVFLAAAFVLFAFTQFRRRSAGPMHWGPKVLTLFFVCLVFINGTLLYIATRGLPESIGSKWLGGGGVVHSGFSGVVPHGQEAAGAVSAELSKQHRESHLGWQVDVKGLNASGSARPIEVRVKDRSGLPVEDLQVDLSLARLGAPAPVSKQTLSVVETGVYLGTLTLPAGGRWLVEVSLLRRGQVLHRSTQELLAP